MSRATDRVIDGLIGALEALRNEHAIAEHCLLAERTRADAWPTGSDNPHTTGGDPTSTTERAALKRILIDTELNAYRDELNAIVLIVRNLRRDCQNTARRRDHAPPDTPRCNGGQGRDGNIEWGAPDCHNIPTRHQLCDNCYMRERRWRITHGLPTRENAA
jgi:hypothetical protein